jgi:predicted nucleic acid-binding Zn ribbon protein
MYCPVCGKENPEKPRFCRSCGLGLQTISQVLGNELSATKSDEGSIEIVEPEQKGWRNPLMYAFLMLLLGMAIVIFGKKIVVEQLIADLGTLIAMLGIGLLGFKGVGLILFQSGSSRQSKTLLEGKPTTELPPALPSGEPASVIEHTTRHFEPIYRERKTKQCL